MRLFRYIARSFYDVTFYQEVRDQWQGWAIGFIFKVYLLLVTVMVIAALLMLHAKVLSDQGDGTPGVLESALLEMAAQWPDMRIEDNEIVVLSPEPATIFAPMLGEDGKRPAVIIFDTSGETNVDTMTAPILVTKDKVHMKDAKKVEIQDLKNATQTMPNPLALDAARMQAYVRTGMDAFHKNTLVYYPLMAIVLIASIVAYLMLMRIILLIPLAFAGWLVARALNAPTDYDKVMRVVCVVLVPVSIIEAVSYLFLQSYVGLWLKTLVAIGIVVLLCRTPNTRVEA